MQSITFGKYQIQQYCKLAKIKKSKRDLVIVVTIMENLTIPELKIINKTIC